MIGRVDGTRRKSCQDSAHHRAVHVSKPEVAAAVAMRESLVIDAEQVEDCGVKVLYVYAVFDGVHAEFVCRAVDQAALCIRNAVSIARM